MMLKNTLTLREVNAKALKQAFGELNASHERLEEAHEKLGKANKKLVFTPKFGKKNAGTRSFQDCVIKESIV